MRLKDRVTHITPLLLLQTLRLLAVIPLGGTIVLSVCSSYTFLFMSPHYISGKQGLEISTLGFSQGFFWSSQPPAHFRASPSQVQPRFHQGQVNEFYLTDLPFKQEPGIPWIPRPPQIQSEVKTSHGWREAPGQGGDWPWGGTRSPGSTRLLVPLTPSNAGGHLLSQSAGHTAHFRPHSSPLGTVPGHGCLFNEPST